jgi:hypothetical protein
MGATYIAYPSNQNVQTITNNISQKNQIKIWIKVMQPIFQYITKIKPNKAQVLHHVNL